MSTTPFLLARVYHHRLHGGDGLPRLLVVCPGCRLPYFADPRSVAAAAGSATVGRCAEQYLAAECPDHAHLFQVDDGLLFS